MGRGGRGSDLTELVPSAEHLAAGSGQFEAGIGQETLGPDGWGAGDGEQRQHPEEQ
ncbi:MAG: hypothetical protein IPK72_09685 [Candidatus Eisenbacteria bacterium]|nr:hypothetical protein [Candidatus Eisenbacteria bacterium]